MHLKMSSGKWWTFLSRPQCVNLRWSWGMIHLLHTTQTVGVIICTGANLNLYFWIKGTSPFQHVLGLLCQHCPLGYCFNISKSTKHWLSIGYHVYNYIIFGKHRNGGNSELGDGALATHIWYAVYRNFVLCVSGQCRNGVECSADSFCQGA